MTSALQLTACSRFDVARPRLGYRSRCIYLSKAEGVVINLVLLEPPGYIRELFDHIQLEVMVPLQLMHGRTVMREGGADVLAAESGAALGDVRAKLESKMVRGWSVAERPHPAIKRATTD